MNILIIGPLPPPYTGQSVSFEKLKDSLSKAKTEKPLSVFHVNTANSNKNHVTGGISVLRLWQTFIIIMKSAWLMLYRQPEVVYLTKGSTKAGFLRDFSILWAKKLVSPNAKFIVHLKGGNYDEFYFSSSFLLKKCIRYFLSRVDTIIVLGNSLIKMYDFFPELKVKINVIENALTTDLPSNQRSSKGHCVNILYLSNLIYSKGYSHLLDACKLLIEKGVTNFKLIYAGQFMESPDDPPTIDMHAHQDEFINAISAVPLKQYVSYVGVVSGDAKSEYLDSTDIFVLPTQYHVEGQPVSIIEAMAYGCAIVSTNYRSIPDLIEDKRNALYVDYGDPTSIMIALEKFINDREFLESCKSQSMVIYQEKFKWDVHFRKMKFVFGIK